MESTEYQAFTGTKVIPVAKKPDFTGVICALQSLERVRMQGVVQHTFMNIEHHRQNPLLFD